MREGTPSGLSTMSTGVPSAMCGMSSTGVILEITPLLPWRPAILSPGCRRRFTATYTLTIFSTPGGSSSPWVSFLRLASNMASNSRRFCASESFSASTCAAASSLDRRMSNQSYFSTPSR